MPNPDRVLRGREIERFLPHRGRNLLVDEILHYEHENPNLVRSQLTIRDGDPLGRDWFLYETSDGERCVHPIALLEHVALVGIVGLEPEPGMLLFFSRVRHCQWTGKIREGEKLNASVQRLRAPKPFLRFDCKVTGPDEAPVLETAIIAYIGDSGQMPGENESRPAASGRSDETRELIARKFPGRDPAMVFTDGPVAIDSDGWSGQFQYTYPTDHPLTAGHFPGQPVMMGVTQVLAIADAVQWLADDLRQAGRLAPGSRIEGKGTLARSGGPQVCQVGRLVLQCAPGPDNPHLSLLEAHTASFRSMVIPPDKLEIKVQLRALDD